MTRPPRPCGAPLALQRARRRPIRPPDGVTHARSVSARRARRSGRRTVRRRHPRVPRGPDLLVPSDFGVYGFYRAGALNDVKARPIAYAGRAACEECHAAPTTRPTTQKPREGRGRGPDQARVPGRQGRGQQALHPELRSLSRPARRARGRSREGRSEGREGQAVSDVPPPDHRPAEDPAASHRRRSRRQRSVHQLPQAPSPEDGRRLARSASNGPGSPRVPQAVRPLHPADRRRHRRLGLRPGRRSPSRRPTTRPPITGGA